MDLKVFLENNKPTPEEEKIFRKVDNYHYTEDFYYLLESMLENNEITPKEYETLAENKNLVIEKFEKYNDYDWTHTFKDAINYVLNKQKGE